MPELTKNPKIFISYCWTTPKHEDWVILLAERLIADGVEVVLDKWDLKEGHDKYTFMESTVNSPEIDKVLMILDKKYSEKANGKSGGVGTETQIISPKVYGNVSQEKFIPIIAERDENGKEYMPTYLESRIYIDLSSQEHYEKNYEGLLRNIFKRPALSKPPLGKAPSYLFDDHSVVNQSSLGVRTFTEAINMNPKRINSLMRDFLDKFYLSLMQYTITFSSRDASEIGKQICDNINSYTPLRNDFITFIDKALKEDQEFDIDILIHFLEKLPALKHPLADRSSWSEFEFDNFRFFIHEIFLYLIAVAVRNEKYKIVEEILYSNYVFKGKYGANKDSNNYSKFYNYIESINSYYNQAYSRNFFSPMAELIIKRIPENYTIENIVEADLICHYVGLINGVRWFPITYVYKTDTSFDFFERFPSSRHFEKTKGIFAVSTPKELKEKLLEIQKGDTNSGSMRYSGSFESVRPIYQIIKIDKIASTR